MRTRYDYDLEPNEAAARRMVPGFPWTQLEKSMSETTAAELSGWVQRMITCLGVFTQGIEAAGREFSPEESLAFDYCAGLAETWKRKIAAGHRPHPIANRDIRGRAADYGSDVEVDSDEKWIDRKTGRSVAVLKPSEPLAQHTDLGYGFADCLRALTLGPRTDSELRAMDGITQGAGGATIPTPLSALLIDAMRARSVAVSLGARTVPMSSRTLDLAKITSDPSVSWRAETDTVATTDVGFDRVSLSAKNMSFMVKCSRELLEDGQNIEQEMRALFARVVASGIDAAVLAGHGVDASPSSYEPRGVLFTDDVNEISGTGPLTSYDDFIDIATAILTANGDLPDAYAIDPETWGVLQKLKETTTNAVLQPPSLVANMRQGVTTALLGSTSPTEGNIIVGGFNEILIGMRSELDIQLLREKFSDTGEYAFWVWVRLDSTVVRPANMGRIVQIG